MTGGRAQVVGNLANSNGVVNEQFRGFGADYSWKVSLNLSDEPSTLSLNSSISRSSCRKLTVARLTFALTPSKSIRATNSFRGESTRSLNGVDIELEVALQRIHPGREVGLHAVIEKGVCLGFDHLSRAVVVDYDETERGA